MPGPAGQKPSLNKIGFQRNTNKRWKLLFL
jgi:hypothetical protein